MCTEGLRSFHPVHRNQGFTLIEVIVAISILALVAVLGWRGLDGIVRGRIALAEQAENMNGMQLTFAQLERDCAQLAPATLIGVRPSLMALQDRLVLIRLAFAEQEPTRVQIVSYRLLNGVLMRQETLATRDLGELDELLRAAATDADANTMAPVVLQKNIATMQIRFWDAASRAWVDPSENRSAGVMNWSGLEMALQLPGQQGRIVKLFSLGAA
ncbi:MAG TPA: prepilin-type N-terminal cleavage/methylation domain-containing protein [Rhodocyclaceae bacterium]|nr:prepilin-type N-terminal cleavage/methylation domain-containing protein [Rhodocyclaceae bacterium]